MSARCLDAFLHPCYATGVLTNLLASAYLHSLDPVIFPIAGDLAVRWYGLSYLIGFLLAWGMIVWLAKTGRSAIPVKFTGDLMFAVVIGVLAGGRLGYVFFYDPSLLVTVLDRFPWWGVLAINMGGMSSHGGMIGAVLACLWFARKHKVPGLHILDVGALTATPGLFLGRLANFINAELWGRRLPDAMQESPPWWSVKYPQEIRYWSPEHLAGLRELMPEVGVGGAEWTSAVNTVATLEEDAPRDAVRLVDYGIQQLIEAVRDGNQVVIEHLQPMLNAYYPSQIFQAITDGPILAAILVLIWLRPRKPGVIGGTFLIAYGALRILTEIFRQPDDGVALLLGLSRGQVLSALMVLIGMFFVWWCTERKVEPMGGLLRRNSPQVHRSTSPQH